MNRLSVGVEGTTKATRDQVWALVANANEYPKWGPWSAGGYDPPAPGPAVVGMKQWFQYGRTKSIEQILEIDDRRRVVYMVIGGIPVKNYRAEIVLEDAERGTEAPGTHVSWSATWDRTLLGRIVERKLRVIYPEIIGSLVAAADRTAH